jgi:proteic killer suppression protein
MKAGIRRVQITRRAEKQLRMMPIHIRRKMLLWVATVEADGLEEARRVPGYHDEPLGGQRTGQRSIRLNRSYRAIYEVKGEILRFVSVEEVSKHDY